jgi:transcriptional regulator of acetoin/glycerol metabolism
MLTRNERDHLLSTLSATNWNKSAAAQKLHWSRMTLYRKMALHGIKLNAATTGGPEATQDKCRT